VNGARTVLVTRSRATSRDALAVATVTSARSPAATRSGNWRPDLDSHAAKLPASPAKTPRRIAYPPHRALPGDGPALQRLRIPYFLIEHGQLLYPLTGALTPAVGWCSQPESAAMTGAGVPAEAEYTGDCAVGSEAVELKPTEPSRRPTVLSEFDRSPALRLAVGPDQCDR
jgi:hypothetical protein